VASLDSTGPPVVAVNWDKAYRLIPSRYPPIDLFEGIAPPEDWEALAELESMTNDRLRDAVGQIQMVAPADRIGGAGASAIMAAFTHIGYPSRFTDGRFGVYYAARSIRGALAEVAYHQARFLARTKEDPLRCEMRSYVTRLKTSLCDVRDRPEVHDPGSYVASQALAVSLRSAGHNGLLYKSVRSAQPCENVAAFKPRAAATPGGPPHSKQGAHYFLDWDGSKIARFFEGPKPSSAGWESI